MNRGDEKRARRAAETPRESRYDKLMVELRKMKIGPIFPGSGQVVRGMRGVKRKATKRPFGLGKPKRSRPEIAIECQVIGCAWTARANAWRPARHLRDVHRLKAHRVALR